MDRHHKLRESRNGRGLTQVKLSQISTVSASTISHIECHRGPDVPREQLRLTKTKYSTAVKLVNALMQNLVEEYSIPAGSYTVEQLIKLIQRELIDKQDIFTLLEIYEVSRAGKPKRNKNTRPATRNSYQAAM